MDLQCTLYFHHVALLYTSGAIKLSKHDCVGIQMTSRTTNFNLQQFLDALVIYNWLIIGFKGVWYLVSILRFHQTVGGNMRY